jgi:NAD-dependent dihydropyrimidine dehydrogenase PreA subunit
MDHEFAHLAEEYLAEGGAVGIMKPQPALHRVIPSQSAVKTEWILPYDDVKAVLQTQKTFSLRDCVCRVQQDLIESRRCSFPVRTCLSFSTYERPPRPDDISKEEALAVLDKFEKMGLVHTVSNIMKGLSYVCNCCGCCCGILRGINDWGIENSVAYANYYSEIDPEKCKGCGTCIKRCQVKAVSKQNGISVVDRKRCIGCGLCVTGCPNSAAKLHRKPEKEIVNPPLDYATWEHERLHNRGIG